jgi:CRISPR/Cas system-associated exonuclease Cas4 (RecB family)
MKNLIQIFNEVLDRPGYVRNPNYKPPFKIKPSMLGSKCLRKVYYSAASVPEDYGFDLAGKKRMKLGESIHEMLSSTFREAGILVDYYKPDGTFQEGWPDKTKPDKEFPLTCDDLHVKKGKVDAVLIIDGQLWLGEYKSINSRGFGTLAEPKSDHIMQTVVYWYIFNMMLAEGKFSHIKELEGFTKVEGARWLYVNKDDTEFKEFTMTQGDKIFTDIVHKITTIKNHYDQKILPPKTDDWCQSCSWRDKCKKNVNIE